MNNSANTTDKSDFTHRQVSIEGVSIHVVTSGQADKPAILFLHGFPKIWHFTFHAIPELPEVLVTGRQRVYFDYYYNTIAAKPDRIDDQARDSYAEAYSSTDALHTGFEWYRTFPQDEKDNTRSLPT